MRINTAHEIVGHLQTQKHMKLDLKFSYNFNIVYGFNVCGKRQQYFQKSHGGLKTVLHYLGHVCLLANKSPAAGVI